MEQADEVAELSKSVDALTQEVRRLSGQVAAFEGSPTELLEQLRIDIHQKIDSIGRRDRRHIGETGQDVVRQVEAMNQLFRKIPAPRAPMPPSGGFPMEARTLLHLSFILDEIRPKRVLELGGGTSTIWMGYLTEGIGTEIISIDHLEKYGKITSEYVERHRFSHRIECRIASLEKISLQDRFYEWYSINALKDVSDVDMLLVDGPPEATGEMARFPALPVLLEQLSPGAVVLLDDTHRETEQRILSDWSMLGTGFEVRDTGVSRLGVLRSSPPR